MSSALIIGSGPAAAGAALALSRLRGADITLVDIGTQLEAERRVVVDRLASSNPSEWDASLVERISAQPVNGGSGGLPQKRSCGSDYPFRNVGQLDGVTTTADVTGAVISGAYGGFSNVWGSQVMPFADSAFEAWPFRAPAMRPHYEAVLEEIPYAAQFDDLAEAYPLLADAEPLPPLSERSQRVLGSYERHRAKILSKGIAIGKARLGFRAADCRRCNLCMTGCPYGLIYSAAHTLDALKRSGRLKHHTGFLALKVAEKDNSVSVIAREIASGRIVQFTAERIFIACGALGSTRLVADSLELYGRDLHVLESQQFVLPFLSIGAVADPRQIQDFTLNQFNMVVGDDAAAADIAQLHFYTFNHAFLDALPAAMRTWRMEPARAHLLRRLSVALGYLPSWRSPQLAVRVLPTPGRADLPEVHISRGPAPRGRAEMLRSVLTRVLRVAPLLDLYPMLPMMRLAAGGKSYHWGGSFPHSSRPATLQTSDRLGRVGPWKRVHLVDASVFPSIPAMTFTLTIMANAHRIASETAELIS